MLWFTRVYTLLINYWPVGSVLPWDRVRGELLRSVVFGEELHPDDGEDVDDNNEDKSEVSQRPYRGYNDAQKHFHCRP